MSWRRFLWHTAVDLAAATVLAVGLMLAVGLALAGFTAAFLCVARLAGW